MRTLLRGIALMTLVGLFGSGPAAAQQTLTWTAGPLGGGWYTQAGAFAELIREKAGITVKVIPGGGLQNAAVMEKGDADMGWGLPAFLSAAAAGEDPYQGKKHPSLRALAGSLGPANVHMYVAADSPFANMTMEEIIRGKKAIRLAVTAPGASDEWIFRKVMEFYGTSYKDWEAAGARFFRGNYAEQAGMFKDRNVDGVFTFLQLPGAAVTEASVGRSLKLVAFPDPLLGHLGRFGLSKGAIPPDTYPRAANARETVATPTMGSTIVVSATLPDDLVYKLARALNDNVDRVRGIHGSLKTYDPSQGHQGTGVPLHPGAERYYREKGYLK